MMAFLLAWYSLAWVTAAMIARHDGDMQLGLFIGCFVLWPMILLLIAIALLVEHWHTIIWRRQ